MPFRITEAFFKYVKKNAEIRLHDELFIAISANNTIIRSVIGMEIDLAKDRIYYDLGSGYILTYCPNKAKKCQFTLHIHNERQEIKEVKWGLAIMPILSLVKR